MAHTITDKQKLLNRVRRLRGQIDAIERALESEAGCTEIMRQIVTAKGAINGVMAEVVADHIQLHMVDENSKPKHSETVAANELVEVLRAYIK